MKRFTVFLIAAVLMVWQVPAYADMPREYDPVADLQIQIEAMRAAYDRQLEELRAQVATLKARDVSVELPPAPQRMVVSEAGPSPQIAEMFGGRVKKFGKAYVGGYYDFEYQDREDAGKNFDQHRLVPFIFADITDRIKFATEIEFEHGGTNNNQDNGEIKVEFAALDYLLNEKINFRAGILLSPLGRYNAMHDSPLQEIATRPIVNRFVIPTTLSEAGAGFYGTFYPAELSKLDYELYAVNGFQGLTAQGVASISTSGGVRSARGNQQGNFNDNLAVAGRLAYSPFLGLELAYSTHVGAYDQRRDNYLWINAADLTYKSGPWEFLAEFAYDVIERDAFAEASGIPDDVWGYYLQANYRFMPGVVREALPEFMKEDSTFALVGRWDHVDLDGNQLQRITPGVTFRPTPNTVFGANYQVNIDNSSHSSTEDDLVELWIATYF